MEIPTWTIIKFKYLTSRGPAFSIPSDFNNNGSNRKEVGIKYGLYRGEKVTIDALIRIETCLVLHLHTNSMSATSSDLYGMEYQNFLLDDKIIPFAMFNKTYRLSYPNIHLTRIVDKYNTEPGDEPLTPYTRVSQYYTAIICLKENIVDVIYDPLFIRLLGCTV